MRIESKFKDYYDNWQKYADYKSKPLVRKLFLDKQESKNTYAESRLRYGYKDVLIGFCGKIYPCLHRPYAKRGNCVWEKGSFYSYEQYLEDIKVSYSSREEKRKFDVYFTVKEDDTLFIKYNAPVFITYRSFEYIYTVAHTMGRGNSQEEVKLSDYEFNKVIPANIAYMNIESYIHGTLFKEYKSIPEMTNEEKISSNGFDKNSFR